MPIFSDLKADPNKILPFNYPWSVEHYKTGNANHWTPEEVPMQNDVEMWKSDRLSEEERKIILWNLGFFSTAESLTANNLVLAVYNHVTDPGCRLYLLRQALEEAIHTQTFCYVISSLNLDVDEIYKMYNEIPSIQKKDDYVVKLTKTVFDPNFSIDSVENVREFLTDLIGFYVIMEGIFFYAGFAMMLSLKRQHKMVGIGEQFSLILRDESVHLAFGCDLIDQIRREHPEAWNDEFEQKVLDLILEAVSLEKEYVWDACPKGFLGGNPQEYCNYVEYVTDRRLVRLGMKKQFDVENPFPWMSAQTDNNQEKNFFETTVTEYQGGGLDWE